MRIVNEKVCYMVEVIDCMGIYFKNLDRILMPWWIGAEVKIDILINWKIIGYSIKIKQI